MAATNVQAFPGDVQITSNLAVSGSKFTYDNIGTTVFTGRSTANASEIGYLDMSTSSTSNNIHVKIFIKMGTGGSLSEAEYSFYIRPDGANSSLIYDYRSKSNTITPVVYRTNANDLHAGGTSGVVRFGYSIAAAQNVVWRVEVIQRSSNVTFYPTNTGSAVVTTNLVHVTPAPFTRFDSNVAVGGNKLFVDTIGGTVGIGSTLIDITDNTLSGAGNGLYIHNPVENAHLLTLGTQRPWVFEQGLADASTELCLRSLNNGKHFNFQSVNKTDVMTIVATDGAGKVGIGTNDPAAKLDLVLGTSTGDDGPVLRLGTGGIEGSFTGGIAFSEGVTSESRTGLHMGIYYDGVANKMHFTDSNASSSLVASLEAANKLMTIERTTGHVGIGTNTPISIFHTHGGALWDGSSMASKVSATLSVARGGGAGGAASTQDAGTGAILKLTHDGTGYRHVTMESVSEATYSGQIGIRFRALGSGNTTAPLERMRISGAGNVGIGDINPASKLVVAELTNTPTLPALTLTHSGVFDYASPNPSSWRSINFSTNTSGTVTRQCGINLLNYSSAGNGQSGIASRMLTGLGFSVHNGSSGIKENALTIKSNGYVGIGTENPTYTLHVSTGNWYLGGTGAQIKSTATNDTSLNDVTGFGAVEMKLNTVFNMRNNTGGARSYYFGIVQSDSGGTLSSNLAWAFSGGANPDPDPMIVMQTAGYVWAKRFYQNGTLLSSDDRIKNNEKRITNATETLLKISPQTYEKSDLFKNPTSNSYSLESGLIVQDVWYDAPELRHLVDLPEDATPTETKPVSLTGNIQDDPDYSQWGSKQAYLSYTGFIPYLIKSVQELHTDRGKSKTWVDDINYSNVMDYSGLIVCADTNTSKNGVPRVTVSSILNDKSCFGVISGGTDTNDSEVFIQNYGHGNIWVTDINGILQSGDYITTSNVAGYGQKQDSDSLKNYTVAKITQDCDFTPALVPTRHVVQELRDVTYYKTTTMHDIERPDYDMLSEESRKIITKVKYQKTSDILDLTEEDQELYTTAEHIIKSLEGLSDTVRRFYEPFEEIYYMEIKTKLSEFNRPGSIPIVKSEMVNVLDEHGQIQWEDDPTGATEKAYKIGYLDANGVITDEANVVHTAAFVGCTYHCG
jgi:hypothetical protein